MRLAAYARPPADTASRRTHAAASSLRRSKHSRWPGKRCHTEWIQEREKDRICPRAHVLDVRSKLSTEPLSTAWTTLSVLILFRVARRCIRASSPQSYTPHITCHTGFGGSSVVQVVFIDVCLRVLSILVFASTQEAERAIVSNQEGLFRCVTCEGRELRW